MLPGVAVHSKARCPESYMVGESDVITPETPKEMLSFTTAQVMCRQGNGGWSGTGFFIRVPVIGRTDQLIFVTNRHIISDPDLGDPDSIEIITPASDPADPSRPLLGQSAYADTLDAKFESHPDPDIDVAVTNVTGLPVAGPYDRFVKALPMGLLFNEESLKRLDALEQVTFIGYPKGLYDEVNMTPVARYGWTATPISLDYEGKPKFMIDANVFEGSSGSPVLALNIGAYQERAGAAYYGNPNIVLL
jgi:hypothetical protein